MSAQSGGRAGELGDMEDQGGEKEEVVEMISLVRHIGVHFFKLFLLHWRRKVS